MPYFVVINEQGPTWVESRSMRDQDGWTEHADFVNSLTRAGVVILGGPIGSGHPHRAMLVVVSPDEATARLRLQEDPWIRSGTLRLARIESWNLLVSQDTLDPLLARFDTAHSTK